MKGHTRRAGWAAWSVAVVVAGLLYGAGPAGPPAVAATVPVPARLACPPSVTYFAEGSTRAGIETLLTLLNQSDSDSVALIGFAVDDGSHLEVPATVPAHSRTNVDVNAIVPAGHD